MAHVQSNIALGSGGTTQACAYSGNVTAGNLLVCVVSTFIGGTTTHSVADSLGQTFTQAGGYATAGANRQSIWFFPNTAAGADTVTATASASGLISVVVLEYSGADTIAPLRNTAGTNGNSSSPSPGSVTAQPGDLIVAAYCQGDGVQASSTVASPFTSRQLNLNGGSREGCQAADDTNATGSETPTFTTATAVNWAATGASFIPAGSMTDWMPGSKRAASLPPPLLPASQKPMSGAMLQAVAAAWVPFRTALPYRPVALPVFARMPSFPFGVITFPVVPGTGQNRPFLPRVPRPPAGDDPTEWRDYFRRLSRHTELLGDFFNSVAAKGQVRQNAPSNWDINPAGGLNVGLTGHYE